MKPNKDEFFENFFNMFEKLRQTVRKPSASKGVDRTQYPGPTPVMQNPTSQGDFHLRVKALTDKIMSLFLNDMLGQRGESSASAFVKASIHPYPTASPPGNRQERLKRLFFNFTVQGKQEDPNFMAKFFASPKLDMENNSAVKIFVRDNIPKIAVGYWKLMSWFLTKLQSRSCGQDCAYIEIMVQFCKNQNRMCGKAEPIPWRMSNIMHSRMPNSMPHGMPSIKHSRMPKIMPSGMPNSMSRRASVRPTPSPSIHPLGNCGSGNRHCPFKSGCFPYSVPCINDRDIFNTMTRAQSRTSLRPTQSMKEMPQPSTKVPSAPSFAGRGYNRTMMEYAWMQASKQMPQLTIGDLAKTYETFYNYLRMDGNEQQETGQSNEICSKICKKHNTTYCWAEMKCKQKGAKCSLKNLKEMMNRTAFENQGSCKGSFFCPVLQNCTSNDASCNAGRFMQLPCDAKCMNATAGKGVKPSKEDIQIFRLKCMDNEKYCPRSLGCVGSNDSCSGNRKLDVPLGDGPEDEQRTFCRMREYICPRVYGAWKTMRCQQSEMFGPEVRPTERLPIFPWTFIPMSKSSMLKPMHTTRNAPTRTVNPHPKPARTTTLRSQTQTHATGPNPKQPHTTMPKPTRASMSNGGITHSTSIQPPMPEFSLPSYTLKQGETLQRQIKERAAYLIVSKYACPSSLEFSMITNTKAKLAIPDSSSGKGILLPLQMYLHYVSTRSSFHGLCLLKYNVLAQNRGASPLQIVRIPAGAAAGALAILIFPTYGEISAKMIGKSFIDIKEDEVNPPCFKLKDKMQFNITDVQSTYNITREFERLVNKDVLYQYQTKLSDMKTATLAAAVTSRSGLSFRSGNWKEKLNGQKFNDFPRYISEKDPHILDMNTCIAFYPAKDFSGKVTLTIVGVLKVFDSGRMKFIFGKKKVVVGVNILSEPDPPELTTEDSCLPPYPYDFDDATNTGFKIETLLTIGKSTCNGKNKYYPLIQNPATLEKSRIGLAIVKVSTCKFGRWEYKDGGAFRNVDVRGGTGLCLFKTARIRFVPANYTTLWSTKMAKQCIWIKAKAWISLSKNSTGHCNVTGDASNLLSKEEVQLSAVRRGCDDVVGSMRKPDPCGRCGKKKLSNIQCPCDGVPGSGAVIDECGYCTGGTTRLVYHKRDCNRECYANGTLSKNVIDSCGRCQNRRFVSKDVRDCNGDCTFGRYRACKNKCGICVGGKTRKALNNGINACGNCIANSSVACAKSLSLSKEIEVSRNQPFIMKITARGYSSLGSLACSLQIIGGSSSSISVRMMYAQRQSTIAKINSDMCAVQEVGDYEIMLRAVISTGGSYRLRCRVDQESSTTSVNQGGVKVINEESTVSRIVPSTINSCRNGSFILLGTGFKNSTDVACGAACEKNCDFKTRGKFINSTAFSCSIEVDSSNKDCVAQDVNLHALVSTAEAPPAFSRSRAKIRVQCVYPRAQSVKLNSVHRVLVIQLDKSASLAIKSRRSCNSFFESVTVGLLGQSTCYLSNNRILILLHYRAPLMSLAAGSKQILFFNRRNLRCQRKEEFSVMQGSAVQRLNVSLPSANLVPEIKGGSSVGTCDDIRLDGATSSDGMGGRINFDWELYKDSTVVRSGGRRPWFKLSGSGLTPNGNYSVRLCISNNYGQSKCKHSKLTVVDNSNNTLIVKINGAKHRKLKAKGRYKFRPFSKLNQCGKRAMKVSSMLFTWQVKDMAGFILSTSEGRILDIKKGELKPGKNYTLQCSVRARLQSKEEVSGDTEITVEVEGSPLTAKIRGGREMTVGCNEEAEFDARPSTDPDNTDEPSRYFWSCNEKGGLPCFNKSNPLQRVSLMETARFRFNVGQNLECNNSYVFSVVYRKGLRQRNASILVTLKPGEPAEVKLDQQQIKNKIILKGYVKTASTANVSWSCIKQEGYGFIDMSNIDMAMKVLPGPILVRGRRKVARRKALILNRDFLEQGTQYLINLAAANADGRSDAQILVKTPSPPTAGEITIEPPNGTALNTSFVISTGNGWTGEIANYDIGYEIVTKKGNKRVRMKPNSVDSYMEDVQLPPGAKEKNQELTIFVTARNLDGLEVTSTKTVQVRQNLKIDDKVVKDSISLCDQAAKERDSEKALRLIRVTSETAKTSNLIEDGDGQSVQQQLTEKIYILMELKIGVDQDILSTLELTTRKEVNRTTMPGNLREKGAKLVSESYIPSASASSVVESKRKRRSVENSPSQEAFTPKSKEEVDSTMAIFDNFIEEEEPGSLQDNIKMNFTNTVPFLVRSLCGNTLIVNEYLLSKSNLSTIRSNRLPGYTLDTNNVSISDASNGSFIRLGSYLKEKYESWNCSDSGLLCTEICVGTILYHHHMFHGEFEGRISDIASTMLIHPETHGVENAGEMTSPMTYTMFLKEIPDSQHTVECRVWNSVGSNWTTDGCNTSYSRGSYATCHCLVLGNVTVFKVAMPIVTTLFPPITTAAAQNTSHSSSPMNGSAVVPTNSTIQTAPKSSSSASRPAIEVSFSFPVNYNDFASKAVDLENAITEMLSVKLNISKSRIVNLRIRPGSIIVTFTLLNNDGYSNEMSVDDLQTQLTTLASNGSLSLVFNGVTLTADPASLKFSAPKPTTHLPPPEKKSKKSHKLVIIISVCVAIIIILAIVIIVWYVRFKKKRAKTMGNDSMYGSTVLFGHDINLQDRSLQSRESIGHNDKQDSNSTELAKKPLNDSDEPGNEMLVQRTTTPEKSPYPSERMAHGNGGIVSVGIGSSTSLKKDFYSS